MPRKTIWIVCSLLIVSSMVLAFYAFLQMNVVSKDLQRFEQKSNALQEEVLRLQEVAIKSQAEAMQLQTEAARHANEVEALKTKLEACK